MPHGTGITHIPAATLSVLMLGPGTRVNHQQNPVRISLGDEDHVGLWDERLGEVSAGKSYADDEGDMRDGSYCFNGLPTLRIDKFRRVYVIFPTDDRMGVKETVISSIMRLISSCSVISYRRTT